MATLGVKDVSEADVRSAAKVIDRAEAAAGRAGWKALWTKGVRRALIVVCVALLSGTARLIVIMGGLDFFIASFAVCVGGTGWTLQGEVFPAAVFEREKGTVVHGPVTQA